MKIQFLGVGAVALAIGAFVACSNSEDAAPSRTVVPAGTSSGTSGTDTGTSGNSGTSGSDPGDSGTDAGEFASCGTTPGCTCTPFDNAARVPLYKPGQPLTPVP